MWEVLFRTRAERGLTKFFYFYIFINVIVLIKTSHTEICVLKSNSILSARADAFQRGEIIVLIIMIIITTIYYNTIIYKFYTIIYCPI